MDPRSARGPVSPVSTALPAEYFTPGCRHSLTSSPRRPRTCCPGRGRRRPPPWPGPRPVRAGGPARHHDRRADLLRRGAHRRRPQGHRRQHDASGTSRRCSLPTTTPRWASPAPPASRWSWVRLFTVELAHYEKIEGVPLSLDGKVNRLAGMVRGNLGAALQGLAAIPLFVGFDEDAADPARAGGSSASTWSAASPTRRATTRWVPARCSPGPR